MAERVEMIFNEPDDARRAVRELLAAGVERRQITLISSEPLLVDGAPMLASSASRIGLFALAGGVIGGLSGWALVHFTSHSYPIATGGMSLVPPLTTGIVIYEVTAVGAILAAVVRLLWETKLPRTHVHYAAEVANECVLIGADTEDPESIREILAAAGGRERTKQDRNPEEELEG